MKEELRQLLESDRYRYYGKEKVSFAEKVMCPMELRYLVALRKAAFYPKKSIWGVWYRIRLNHFSAKTHIQIPTAAQIGKGLYIGHFGRIILHPDVILGDNVNLSTGITLGVTRRGEKQGAPIIGNRVWIGANAVIVGKVKIGDDVLIAPNAYVNTDIPSHSIVIGNPAVIHPADMATEAYINKTV